MKTVAIIPAFNEEKRVFQAISDVYGFVDDVVVVDDCSLDKTGERAFEAGAHVLRHIVNRGQGAALQTGTDYALKNLCADIIVHFDADGQMQGSDVPNLIAPIETGEAQVVLGSRFLGAEAKDMPTTRLVTLQAAMWFTRFLSGIKITDTHCGFRALSAEAAGSIRLTMNRMAHASELLDILVAKRLPYVERPVTIRYSSETLRKGQSFMSGFIILKDLFKGRFIDEL